MGRLRSFAHLAPWERWLALRSHGWLFAARIALRLLPFRVLRRFIESRRATTPRQGDEWPAAVRRGILRAARSQPGSSCLAQAAAAELLLRWGGHPAQLTIGVASHAAEETVPLDAHAWVESGGLIVAGEGELERYTALVRFGNDK